MYESISLLNNKHSYDLKRQEHLVALLLRTYAAVNGHLELPLLKDRQRFDAVSTSNLEVHKFRDR